MKTSAPVRLVLLFVGIWGTGGQSAEASERVITACVVPSLEQAVGEVRLLRRGGVDVVQTLLETTLMRRVVAEIRVKEERNWPAGQAGSKDAQRYLSALELVQQSLWKQAAASGNGSIPAQRLAIEFRVDGDRASVLLAEFRAEGEIGRRRAVQLIPRAELALTRLYVRRNMRLILEDACHPNGEQIDQWLRELSGSGEGH